VLICVLCYYQHILFLDLPLCDELKSTEDSGIVVALVPETRAFMGEARNLLLYVSRLQTLWPVPIQN